jgi:hypothetical protein
MARARRASRVTKDAIKSGFGKAKDTAKKVEQKTEQKSEKKSESQADKPVKKS